VSSRAVSAIEGAQLHRNPGRGRADHPRVAPDATAEPSSIAMRVIAHRPLPIDPEANVRSAILPIDADRASRLRASPSRRSRPSGTPRR
jgi:hypothetical protein